MQFTIREGGSLLSREIVIEDQTRQVAYRAPLPVVHLREELRLDDAKGVEQAWIKDMVLGDGSKYEIWRGGARYADINRLVDGDLLAGFDISVITGETLLVRGDIQGRNFTIMSHGELAARVQPHKDALDVRVEHQDEVLLLASVVAIRAMIDNWTRARAQHG